MRSTDDLPPRADRGPGAVLGPVMTRCARGARDDGRCRSDRQAETEA